MEIIRDIAMIQNGLRHQVVYEERVGELEHIAGELSGDDVASAALARAQNARRTDGERTATTCFRRDDAGNADSHLKSRD